MRRTLFAATSAALVAGGAGCELDEPVVDEQHDEDPALDELTQDLTNLSSVCAVTGSAPTLTVTLSLSNAGNVVLVQKSSTNQLLINNVADCNGQAVALADIGALNIVGGSGEDQVIVDYVNGLFLSGNAAGNAIIDFNGTSGTDTLRIRGTKAVDTFTLGLTTVNGTTTNIKTAADANVDINASNIDAIVVSTGAGADIIKAGGDAVAASDTQFPVLVPVTMYGGDANDLFVGGSEDDVFYGGAGVDTVDYSARTTITEASINDVAIDGCAEATCNQVVSDTSSAVASGSITGTAVTATLNEYANFVLRSAAAAPNNRYRITGNTASVAPATASGTLTLTGGTAPANNATVTIGGHVYTFVTVLSTGPDVPDEVLIGPDASDSIDNLIAAITAGAGSGTAYGVGTVAHATVTAAAGAGDTMTVTALAEGAAANSIGTTESLATGSFGGATLAGGVTRVRPAFSVTAIGSAAATPTAGAFLIGGEFDNIATDVENLTGSLTAANTLSGTSGSANVANVLTGGAAADTISGLDGNDTLNGNGGNDTIHGGAGVDTLNGAAGDDILNGDDGVDTINGGDGNDTMAGGDGNDVLKGDNGDDTFDEGSASNGADQLNGGAGIDTVSYANRTAAVTVTIGVATAGNGDGEASENDDVKTDVENVTGASGAFVNTLTGNSSANVLVGGAGADVIYGGTGDDYIVGNGGADTLGGGCAVACLLDGDDFIEANDGVSDTLVDGGSDNDICLVDTTPAEGSVVNCE